VIEAPADAAAFAEAIAAQPSLSQGGTSISTGLLAARRLLRTGVLESDRQVIDVSGDGPNNEGPDIERTRDALIARGVTRKRTGDLTAAQRAKHDRIIRSGLHCIIL
jgi:hypothetical protein